jgi:hypothetical protein
MSPRYSRRWPPPAQPCIFRTVDHAHSAATQAIENPVVADGGPNHVSSLMRRVFKGAGPIGRQRQACR